MKRILIKAEREYLREVFSRIEKGEYAVPSFQRDFIWKWSQIAELFDSIIKGYPIGAITLWHSEESYGRKDILSDKPVEDRQSDYYILDGRQRMTALYGCCTGKLKGTDTRFSLSYDLDNEKLVSGTGRGCCWIVPIDEIYDTYKMLGRLQEIQSVVIDGEVISHYCDRLKQLNTILQEYVISEILIERCSLKEAGEVFARINSKGTEINQMDMLHAVVFGSPSNLMMKQEIKKIKKSLEPDGFENLEDGTIMNCFYQFAGLAFYENKALSLSGFDFSSHWDEISFSIKRTAAFLHDHCYVLNSKFLPYSRQFIALTGFFRSVQNPSQAQLNELRRWFFYTTACQSFMNGSLSNVRSIFNKFNEFIEGNSLDAGNYDTVRLPKDFSFRFSAKSALSNLVMLVQIERRIMNNPNLISVKKCDYFRISKNPSGYFPILTKQDKTVLSSINHREVLDSFIEPISYDEYFLSDECIKALSNGNTQLFESIRTHNLIEGEKELLKRNQLSVE